MTITGAPEADGLTIFEFDDVRVIVADKKTAGGFWQAQLEKTYDISPDVPSVLVHGPHLLRSATVSNGDLNLYGDLNGTTTIDIYGPTANWTHVTWNGQEVDTEESELGTLRTTITFEVNEEEVALPELEWVCADSLPELSRDYDDETAEWVEADITNTSRPEKPFFGKVSSGISYLSYPRH